MWIPDDWLRFTNAALTTISCSCKYPVKLNGTCLKCRSAMSRILRIIHKKNMVTRSAAEKLRAQYLQVSQGQIYG